MNKVYIHPKCSTCKKATDFLTQNSISFEMSNLLETPPTLSELQSLLKRGLSIQKLFNTSGILFREMKFSKLAESMSDEEILKKLIQEPMLLKRPLLINPKCFLTGLDKAIGRKMLIC